MKKMFVIDLDGTLLNQYAKLSEKTIEYIQTIKNDHYIIINTGRPYYTCHMFYTQLGLDTPFISDNGGTIWHNLDESVSFGIDYHIINQLGKKFDQIIKSAFFVHGKDVYAYNYNKRLLDIFYVYIPEETVKKVELVDLKVNAVGFVMVLDNKSVTEFEDYVKNELKDAVGIRFWGADAKQGIYELYAKDVSKMSAITYLQKMYNVSDDNVYSFGDGINDQEMIVGVKNSVAMKNASALIRSLAKSVTDHPHHDDGVVRHIEKILLGD